MVMRMGWGSKEVHDTERNLIYSDKGTYGTSGFMTGSELHQVLMLVSEHFLDAWETKQSVCRKTPA